MTSSWGGRPSSRRLAAAGGVVWRPTRDGEVQIAVVHRPRYDDWSLPKGKPDGAEHPVQTAVREAREETGQRVVLGRPLGSSVYEVTLDGSPSPKQVKWYSMEAVHDGPVTGQDVDEVRWLTPAAALASLTQARDQDVLNRFLRGPAAPRLTLLVRHAEAGRADRADPDDDLRPLSTEGQRQVADLVPILAAFGPTHVVSAPVLRCRQTVAPLASQLDLDVEIDDALGEAQHAVVPGRARTRLAASAAYPSAVLCSQGTVIADSLQALTAGHPDIETPKGCTWVLAYAADQLVSADPLTSWAHCRNRSAP